ncbi:hypothetical protein BDW22DRAFT_1428119 [Trametopsis cervina]|nr:hypothetical protein BDW22DRAFT_1428119 [Trametopsis cervina]
MSSVAYWLEAIAVQSLDPSYRLKCKLQLEVSIDDKKLAPHTFEKGQEICVKKVEPTMRVSAISIYLFSVLTIVPTLPVIELSNVSTTIDNGHTILKDTDGHVSITLTFSVCHDGELAENATMQSKDALKGKQVLLDKPGKARGVVEFIMDVGDKFGDVHPAAKATFFAPGLLQEACERQETCRDAAMSLTSEFESFLAVKDGVAGLQGREKSREALDCSGPPVYGYTEKITSFKTDFERMRRQFFEHIQIDTFQLALDSHQDATLMQLNPVKKAYYSSELGYLDGTRVKLLDQISKWAQLPVQTEPAEDPALAKVFWLHGLAGSGKSTVTHTVAKLVKERRLYLSCFFCKRDDSDRSAADRLLPTLAYQFAQQHPSYREALIGVLQGTNSGEVFGGAVNSQLKLLFMNILPLTTAPSHPGHRKPARSIAFSSDNIRLVSGSEDFSIRI